VLLPSRGRPESLRRSISSLRSCAAGEVEVLVAADADDEETVVLASVYADVTLVTERHGYGQLWRYYNELASAATGSQLLLWNDDATMLTARWDDALGAFDGADVILSCASNDEREMVMWPVVPARYVEAVGFYAPETPHVDSFWQDVGRALGIVRPVAVEVFHDRADLTGGHDDATWREGRAGLAHAAYFDPGGQVQEEIRRATLLLGRLLGDRSRVPAP
jgi:hypothetical protein